MITKIIILLLLKGYHQFEVQQVEQGNRLILDPPVQMVSTIDLVLE